MRVALLWLAGYDRGSGHLRGARNGEPGWAAPLTIVLPDCDDHPLPP